MFEILFEGLGGAIAGILSENILKRKIGYWKIFIIFFTSMAGLMFLMTLTIPSRNSETSIMKLILVLGSICATTSLFCTFCIFMQRRLDRRKALKAQQQESSK